MSDNTITLVGNLTRDPLIKYSAAGRAITTFTLAVNRRYQSNGEWEEQTSFFNVTAWGELGENAAASFLKGCRAIVFGRLEYREFTTKDGDKRNTIDVIADDLGPSLKWATAILERNEPVSEKSYAEKVVDSPEEPF